MRQGSIWFIMAVTITLVCDIVGMTHQGNTQLKKAATGCQPVEDSGDAGADR